MKVFENTPIRPPLALAVGFVYWLLFLLALEPGNIMNTGGELVPLQESLRILGASLLGACAAPLILAMVRRYPVDASVVQRNALIQIAGCIAIAAMLVATSCVLADWFLPSEHRPFLTALRQEMEGNGPLVAFCTVGFAAMAHTRLLRRITDYVTDRAPGRPAYLASVTITTRGRTTLPIDVTHIDWIEAQGNYLAFHCGPDTHLLRTGLAAFEAKLDPRDFVRIHRRIIVAIDRVREIAPPGAGDANLRLSDGTELRLSRTYRAVFMAARAAFSSETAGATLRTGSLEVADGQSYSFVRDGQVAGQQSPALTGI